MLNPFNHWKYRHEKVKGYSLAKGTKGKMIHCPRDPICQAKIFQILTPESPKSSTK
jgi:hypothetical protein